LKIITFADGFSSATPPTIESDTTKANVDLGNLSSTAINQDLLPVDTTKNLGSLLKYWSQLFANTINVLSSINIGSSSIQKNNFSYLTEPDIGIPSGSVFIGSGNTSSGSNAGTGDVYLLTGTPDGVGVQGIISLNAKHVSLNSTQIKDLADPISAQDAVTKSYSNNPANITQTSSYRFVTDAEKTAWNASAIYKDTYANLVTWASTATDSALAFSTDTKILYYVVTGVLQEIDVMRTISGTITTAQITVGTSAVRATVSGSAPNANRKRLKIKPSKNNTGAIFYGASGLTTATAMEIIGPDGIVLDWDASDYYLISDTTGQVVEILEVI
jgi:hypothetical protein